MYIAVFPGQGSQRMGMLAELAQAHTLVEKVFKEASHALGYDLWRLTQAGPKSQLNETEFTQPALLAAGVACYQVWRTSCDVLPSYMAGHSLGEYTALVCSGAMDFTDACKVVARRGQFMQQAVPEGSGGMAAIIGLSDDEVIQLCANASEKTQSVVACANFNCDGQVVISGHMPGVELACQFAETAGALLSKLLPVSVPSHCELMRSAANALERELESIPIKAPSPALMHNVDGRFRTHPDDIRQALVDQLVAPVRWRDTIKTLIEDGVKETIEFGPGRVLVGLNKRIDRGARHHAVFDPNTLRLTTEKITDQEKTYEG